MNIPFLHTGNKVGIVAPARKVSTEDVQPAIATLEGWGLQVVLGQHIFDQEHQFAGTDQARAADLQKLIDDPDVRAIFCVRGGYGCARLLPHINFAALQRHPKWIVGYSDITAFHLALAQMDIPSIHGTMPIHFTAEHRESVASLRQMLWGEWQGYRWDAQPLNVNGTAQGILRGGNLSLLYSLQATPYALAAQDTILFIEDVDEYLYHIDRMMLNLALSGVLRQLKGILVGGMTQMKDNTIPYGKTAYEIIAQHTQSLGIPVVFGFAAGHQKPNKALPLGTRVQLQADSDGQFCTVQGW
ncbi:peptidase S66 [Bacteroidia bacterium]|nr:peptidase S66 [Bacteroidia bacterium]